MRLTFPINPSHICPSIKLVAMGRPADLLARQLIRPRHPATQVSDLLADPHNHKLPGSVYVSMDGSIYVSGVANV